MRAELLPPKVTDRWEALIGQAYERLEAGDSPALVTETLSMAAGYAVDAEWLEGVFGSVSAPVMRNSHVIRSHHSAVVSHPHAVRSIVDTDLKVFQDRSHLWCTAVVDATRNHVVRLVAGCRSLPVRD